MTTPSTGDAQVQANQQAAAKLGVSIPGVGGGSVPVITPQSVTDNPAPIDIPTPTPATAAPALDGALTSTTDAFTKQLSDATAAAKTKSDDSLQNIMDSLLKTEGQSQLTDEAYKANGVDAAQKELTDTNNQIIAERTALQHKLDALDKNPGGLFGDALQQYKDQATKESLSRQADLAVIQLSKQGAYDSAKAIADRAVAAKFEQEQNRNQMLQFIYEQNKDLFTTAEQQEFETKQADRNRILDQKVAQENARYEELIKQNDPQYQATLAKTYADIANESAPSGTLNGKPQTTAQATAQGYADRMKQAEQSIAKLGSQFTGNFAIGGMFPNQLQSGDRQVYEQAKRNFVNAVLRQESGAAISPSEFASAEKQYFPAARDSPAVIATKAANRNTAINNFYREANVPRPVGPGDVIQGDDDKQYVVGDDGQTITPINP